MLFDDFDKKIKEAAEQHHPAYDENAWRKMESLLNQHLPRENNRRRFFLLAFAVLLIGGGAFYFVARPHGKKEELSDQQHNTSANSTNDKTEPDKTDKNVPVLSPQINNGNAEIASGTSKNEIATKIEDKGANGLKIKNRNEIFSHPMPDNKDVFNNNNTGIADERQTDITVNQPNEKGDKNLTAPLTSNTDNNSTVADNSAKSVTKSTDVKNNPEVQENPSATKTTPKKGKPRTANGLSFFVSAGPDVSKAQNSKTGKVTLSWGLGVAYTMNRFTLKTGIFTANKIYWAGPDDYKLSYAPPPALKFMGADANCRVMEIPVKLSYDFVVNNRSSWFAGAGLSSYLMKREDYNYEYKTSTGTSYYHSWEAKNENKHYFSVLNFSGGYSYRLSPTISLSAEPYLEVPLTGIGEGKVHLNSGGILFTVGVSPFRK